jgi:hypothetical protein
VTLDQLGNRKALAAYCHAQVARGVAKALTGRPQSELPPPPKPVVATVASSAGRA